MNYVLAPSILAADFGALREALRIAEEAGADCFHFDVMDGCFVPNISFGSALISTLRGASEAFFDVHMMVEQPERYLADMREAGADRITIHAEATRHLDRALNQIRELGASAGVALNPATPVSVIEQILPLVDMVLIMSVNPGFGGQKLIPYTLDKLRALSALRDRLGLPLDLGIDGGVAEGNLPEIVDSGANFIVAGSSVFRPQDKIGENVRGLLSILEKAGK